MSKFSEAFEKLKSWFVEGTKDLAAHLSPVAEHIEQLVVSHLKDVALSVGAVVVQGINDKKSADEIHADALNAVKISFKAEANEALHDAAVAVAKAVVNAHLDIVPDYSKLNK